jgi:hypothetical protein
MASQAPVRRPVHWPQGPLEFEGAGGEEEEGKDEGVEDDGEDDEEGGDEEDDEDEGVMEDAEDLVEVDAAGVKKKRKKLPRAHEGPSGWF